MNDTQKLLHYIVSEALKTIVGEVSATGGANTGGGDTFAVTPGEGYVTPKAFKKIHKNEGKTKRMRLHEDDEEHDIRSLGTHAPSPGQVPAGFSGDIEAMKKNLNIGPQDKIISTKRGGRNNPYALAHWLAKKGVKPIHEPIPAHEPAEKLPGELDRQSTIDREARLRAAADARRGTRAKRGPKPKIPHNLPEMPTGTNEDVGIPLDRLHQRTYPLQRTPGHPDFRGPVPVRKGVTDYNSQPLKPASDKTNSQKNEVAPPGMEDTVMALKKKYPKDQAFKIAWSIYNRKKSEGIVLLKNLIEDKAEDESVKSKIKYKTKGDNSPVIIINPPEKTEESRADFGIKSSGENDVMGGGSTVGSLEASVGKRNGRMNELSPKLLTRAAKARDNQAQAASKEFLRLNRKEPNASTDRFLGRGDIATRLRRRADALRRHAVNKKNEVAPKGWEGTVKAMKKHKDIDNPWALANYMKNKGDTPHK